jgi:hypothetical protein
MWAAIQRRQFTPNAETRMSAERAVYHDGPWARNFGTNPFFLHNALASLNLRNLTKRAISRFWG